MDNLNDILTDDLNGDALEHYGTPRHSGRYPWGSGENPYQARNSFLGTYRELKAQGLTDAELAAHFGVSINELRRMNSVASEQARVEKYARVEKLKAKGYSNTKIGEMMGMNESSVREALKNIEKGNINKAQATINNLQKVVDQKGMIDIGAGAEHELGSVMKDKVSATKLNTAVSELEKKGYEVHNIFVEQANNPGQYTTVKVLCKPGTEKSYVLNNKDKIESIEDHMAINKKSADITAYPQSISSDRVCIKYHNGAGDDTDGITKDGVIEIRRGVADLDLGNSNYAQVRIAVDGTHYLKGMAMYSDNIPKGYDILFNTNKTSDVPKMEVLKELKNDADLPFGAKIKANGQYYYKFDEKGKMIFTDSNDKDAKLGAINKVNEEGDWDTWSKSLSSQFLSKQNLPLIKRQLSQAYAEQQQEYNDIMELTNPVIKKKLLNAFAGQCDTAAVELKAAALPRQRAQVILPFNDIKENEIYAPNFKEGEHVVLIRYPHAGIFEIPECVVTNKKSKAKDIIGNAVDAVGINAKTAERLSGADFDGDTVLVIPVNDKVRISTAPALKELVGFDPKTQYKLPKDAPQMKSQTKQTEMGKVSNLITDMTIRGADLKDIAKAVKHSMVVIDAEKHHLDYKQSYIDNDIAELKAKYQSHYDPETGKMKTGASTLISRASGEVHIPERKQGAKIGDKTYYVDPETGENLYRPTNRTYVDKKTGKVKIATESVAKMQLTNDAFTLSSGTEKEAAYATYANKLKTLANQARKEALSQPGLDYSPSANKTYASEVESLDAKLRLSLKNAPKERQAQLVASAKIDAYKKDNPNVDKEHLKKFKQTVLNNARAEAGANKQDVSIHITDKEWKAIQSGAISTSKLNSILNNTDLDEIKKLATPRSDNSLSSSKVSLIKTMESKGYTTSEIADRLGVSTSTVHKYARSED